VISINICPIEPPSASTKVPVPKSALKVIGTLPITSPEAM